MRATAAQMAKAKSPRGWANGEELRWAVRDWAARMAIRAPQIHIRKMRRKWASISAVGRLTLNAELLEVPKRLGEFVIVHELVHRLAPNHGKVFKSFMHAYLPDWEARELDLKYEATKRLALAHFNSSK